MYKIIARLRYYQPSPCQIPLQWHYLPHTSSSETWPFLSGFFWPQFRRCHTFLRAFYTSVRNNIRRNVEILQILIHHSLCEMWFRSPDSRHGFPATFGLLFLVRTFRFHRRTTKFRPSVSVGFVAYLIQFNTIASHDVSLHWMKTYTCRSGSNIFWLQSHDLINATSHLARQLYRLIHRHADKPLFSKPVCVSSKCLSDICLCLCL